MPAFTSTQSADELVGPLAGHLAARQAGKGAAWEVPVFLGENATKARLTGLVGREAPPALLFVACHGMWFPRGDMRQRPHQGALLCQDWPGPLEWHPPKPIPPEYYLAADDVGEDDAPAGLIAIFFACYGAGTPRLDDFARCPGKAPPAIAPEAFLARLPQRLLGHPRGGALAVLGHVERAWGCSFFSQRAGRQLEAFEATLDDLLRGRPVGAATEWLNQRHAELAVDLNKELVDVEQGKIPDHPRLAGLWTAHQDARNYVLLGDPAVRVNVDTKSCGGCVR
jgi:hypothetical protein